MAVGLALALALSPASSALAKSLGPAHAVRASSHSAPAHPAPDPAPVSSVRPPAKSGQVAHAAGHKIA
jgi:hypothetical protein